MQTDLIVLGGGSAAFAAAIKAAELGKQVALVEGGLIGGTCVNVGCVPSKALIAAAEVRHTAQRHPFAGIERKELAVDFPRLIAEKDELVSDLRQAKYLDVLSAYPSIAWVRGMGRVLSARPPKVAVDDQVIEGKRLVVATGAEPFIPPIPGLEGTPYWTSTEALAATELPESLVVLGGAAVGLELAQLYARLGTRVTVLEAMDRLVPQEDEDVSQGIAEALAAEGISVVTGAAVQSVAFEGSRGSKGSFTAAVLVGGEERRFSGERLLLATGRRPKTRGFGLEEAGVKLDARGAVVVNEHLETSVPGVFAAGDVTGQAMFVYVAAYAGTLAAENAFGKQRRFDLSALPKVTFTDPQIASVGLPEREARARGVTCRCSTLPLAYVPRALANRDTRGFVKVVAEEGTGRVLGVHILAPSAGEIIQPAVFAVKYEMTLDDIRDNFFPYLTMVEGLKLAALTFQKDVKKLSCCAG